MCALNGVKGRVLEHGYITFQEEIGMIRPTYHADAAQIVDLARDTGVFKPMEIEVLHELLDIYLNYPQQEDYRFITFEQDGQVLGFACYGPTSMTDRTWDLYWIAVQKSTQARGIGGQLLGYVESEIRRRHGRLVMVETSSTPAYDLTRQFYLKHHYEQAAVIQDFYADGDSLVIFRKRVDRPE